MQSTIQIRQFYRQAEYALRQVEEKQGIRVLGNAGHSPSLDEKSEDSDLEGSRKASPDNSSSGASHKVGFPQSLPGIEVRERTQDQGGGGLVFVVGWDGADDPMNPQKWSTLRRVVATTLVSLIAFTVTAASSVE